MNSKTTNYVLLGIILLAVVAGAWVYPMLPEKIASHWDAAGEVNGYMGKFWGIFLFPLIMAVIFLVYFIIPKIDPLKNNIESFRGAYNAFWVWTFLFFLYIFGLTLAWNFGYQFNFSFAMIPALAVLFYAIGAMLEKIKRNWFIGIRTPWTLSSDLVWEKTHKLGGKLFKIAALIMLVGVFLQGSYLVAVILIPIIVVAVVTIAYSYVIYKKHQ